MLFLKDADRVVLMPQAGASWQTVSEILSLIRRHGAVVTIRRTEISPEARAQVTHEKPPQSAVASEQQNPNPSTRLEPEGRGPREDSEYFSFGSILRVEEPASLDKTNPHHIAQYSVYLCKQGHTSKMIQEIGHVETDRELGQAFLTFLKEFGPDLERYKDKEVHLKFHGYKYGVETSTWYYYLSDAKGGMLDRMPWISLHRSNRNKRCALTGIFLNLPGEEPPPMPDSLKTAK